MRACENIYAVGDSVGMCRFTTKLFNSPSLPGIEEFRSSSPTSPACSSRVEELEQCGLNVMGVERLINHRLGVGARTTRCRIAGSTSRIPPGPTRASRSIAQEFDAMLSRFYEISRLTSEGVPRGGVAQANWSEHWARSITVNFPAALYPLAGPVDDRVASRCRRSAS